MADLLKYLEVLSTRETGQALTEYALVILLVAIAVVAALMAFAGDVGALYTAVGNAF